MTNETKRVLELLKRFNDGKKVCIKELQNDSLWYNDNTNKPMSDKSIRRDLSVIKKYFPDSFELIRGEKGCYKAITSVVYNELTFADNMSLLVQTFNIAQRSTLLESLNISKEDKEILEKKIKKSRDSYRFISKPLENRKSDIKLYQTLEGAIKRQKRLVIEYEAEGIIERREVKPYKILFMNENFYLACEVENEEYIYTPFKISNIKHAEESSSFNKNYDLDGFINEIQTPFAKYTQNFREHLIDITLEIDSVKAAYFKAKRFLPSQRIVKEQENGNLVVTYKVTQEREIEDLVKCWIPHLKVISPLSLKEKIHQDIMEYLQ